MPQVSVYRLYVNLPEPSRLEWVNECIGLLASIEGCFRIAGHPPGYLIRLPITQRSSSPEYVY
jgi:hypothetical protein